MPKPLTAKVEIYQGKRLINKYHMGVCKLKIEDGISKNLDIELHGYDISLVREVAQMKKCRNCKKGSPTGQKVYGLKAGICFNVKTAPVDVVETGTCIGGFERGIPWEKRTISSKESQAQDSQQKSKKRSAAQTKQGTTTRRKQRTGTKSKDTK